MPEYDNIYEDRQDGNEYYAKFKIVWDDGHPVCEKRKTRYCDQRQWNSCPLCKECRKCPPAFRYCPEHDNKECEWKDECDRKREHGEMEAYGYVYSLTAATATVAPNADVVFTNNGPIRGITHTPNTSQLFIRKSGVYQIYYGVNTTAGTGSVSLAVNGAVDPATTISVVSPGESSGSALLNLRAGDFLTLRNSSATTTLSLAIAPVVGAQLTLERIDDLKA